MKHIVCEFQSLDDRFNFGRYWGLSLSDVLDINPSYLDWCMKYCTGVIFLVCPSAIEEIRQVYPRFRMDNLFEIKRQENFQRQQYEEEYEKEMMEDALDADYCYFDEPQTYERFGGTWAQDVAGYSDDEIDTIFDGDPSAYWNID